MEELKAQIAKLQANIDSKAENVEKFNLVSDVISPEYWKAAITKNYNHLVDGLKQVEFE